MKRLLIALLLLPLAAFGQPTQPVSLPVLAWNQPARNSSGDVLPSPALGYLANAAHRQPIPGGQLIVLNARVGESANLSDIVFPRENRPRIVLTMATGKQPVTRGVQSVVLVGVVAKIIDVVVGANPVIVAGFQAVWTRADEGGGNKAVDHKRNTLLAIPEVNRQVSAVAGRWVPNHPFDPSLTAVSTSGNEAGNGSQPAVGADLVANHPSNRDGFPNLGVHSLSPFCLKSQCIEDQAEVFAVDSCLASQELVNGGGGNVLAALPLALEGLHELISGPSATLQFLDNGCSEIRHSVGKHSLLLDSRKIPSFNPTCIAALHVGVSAVSQVKIKSVHLYDSAVRPLHLDAAINWSDAKTFLLSLPGGIRGDSFRNPMRKKDTAGCVVVHTDKHSTDNRNSK